MEGFADALAVKTFPKDVEALSDGLNESDMSGIGMMEKAAETFVRSVNGAGTVERRKNQNRYKEKPRNP